MAERTSGIILHPAYEQARSTLTRALDATIRGQIIFVVGLSGAGKSEIRYSAMRSFAGPPTKWSQGHLPAFAVRATPSDRSNFSPKEFTTRMYLELQEPNVDWLLSRSMVGSPDGGHVRADARLKSELWAKIRRSGPEHQLRHFVERMAVTRGVRAIFIEEAASLTYTGRHKQPGDHMVNYMCLAEEVGSTLVLFGVPRMAALWEGNAEILRRSRFVFVNRYRLDLPSDRENFERLVLSVGKGFRFSNAGLLRQCLDLAYASSAGVFGELVAYLTRADDLRASEGSVAITKKHMEDAISTDAVLKTLYEDAALFDSLKTPANARLIRGLMDSQR
ncbi:hypothetical protein [Dyella subtropica]|uniref:hypothetical protein n=1 Tax=Dyella subtropica TaxID=2992127 RepID=UPI002259270E|nr:hypothetical protein [Dyella subtropica]